MAEFIETKCKKCGDSQRIFTHSAMEIKCSKCSEVLATPAGGIAKFIY